MKLHPFALTLALGLVAVSASAQTLGGEIEVAAPRIVSTAGSQGDGQLVQDGDGYAVVFGDRTCSGLQSRIVRLDAAGETREEVATRVDETVSDAACADDECAGLVYETDPSGRARVRVVRFALDGTTHDSAIAVSAAIIRDYTVASTSSGFAVMYTVYDAGDEWVGFRSISAGGLGSEVRLHMGTTYGVGLGCGASGCLAVWSDGTGVDTLRVTDDGSARGAVAHLTTPAGSLRNVVARAAGTGWAVALTTLVGGLNTLTGWRLAADGSAGAAVDLGGVAIDEHALACDPDGLCLIEHRTFGSFSNVIDVWNATGLVPGSTLGVAEPSDTSRLWCSVSGGCVRVALADLTLHLTRLAIGPGGIAATSLPQIGTGADVLGGPLALEDGLVVFHRQVGAASTRVLVTATTDGRTAPATEGHELGAAAWLMALAHGEDGYGLLTAGSETHFRVLDESGLVSGDDTYLGATLAFDVDVAWNGTHYLAAVSYGSAPLTIRRFDAIGQPVDATPTTLSTVGVVAVASDGESFLVVALTSSGLRGMRFSDDLTPLDGPGFLIRTHELASVDVAFDGAQYVAVWDETTTTTTPSGLNLAHQIRATRISTAGEVLDLGGVVVDRPEDSTVSLQVAASGGPTTWIAWSGSTVLNQRQGRVVPFAEGSGGTALELFEASAAPPSFYDGLAIGGARPVVAYSQNVSPPELAPSRVRARVILDGNGTTCSDPSGCASGFCSSGVCCDSACDGACEACTATGTCAPRSAGFECRPAEGACDVAETCDGTSAACPAAVDAACDAGSMPALDGSANDGGVGSDTGGGGGGGGCSVAIGHGTFTPAWLLGIVLVLRRRRRSR